MLQTFQILEPCWTADHNAHRDQSKQNSTQWARALLNEMQTRGRRVVSKTNNGFYWVLLLRRALIRPTKFNLINFNCRVADIALWFRLRLPSCGPGFESQAHHLRFFNLYYWNCNEKITKINKKRPSVAGVTHSQWICLRLPTCRPRFKSQAHHLCYYQFKLWHVEKTKNRKRGRDWPIF